MLNILIKEETESKSLVSTTDLQRLVFFGLTAALGLLRRALT